MARILLKTGRSCEKSSVTSKSPIKGKPPLKVIKKIESVSCFDTMSPFKRYILACGHTFVDTAKHRVEDKVECWSCHVIDLTRRNGNQHKVAINSSLGPIREG